MNWMQQYSEITEQKGMFLCLWRNNAKIYKVGWDWRDFQIKKYYKKSVLDKQKRQRQLAQISFDSNVPIVRQRWMIGIN